MTDKRTLREKMRAMRKGLSSEAQRCAGEAVFERVIGFAPYQNARCVMAYIACRGELSLAPVIEDILARGKTLALPRCEEGRLLTARKITTLDALVPGMFGLMEPAKSAEIVPPEKIDLIFVPGTAFDRALYRLGQGGGYYDRFLGGTDALRVGLCHDMALLESVPREAHDMRMDAVITPGAAILRRD